MTACLVEIGYVLRMTRASVVEVLNSGYVRTAILKGLTRKQVITRHVLRNAMMAPITVIMLHVNWFIGGLVSMGMPGFSGFIAEFPIFLGVWQKQPWIAIVASISIVITASYIIRVIGRVFFGQVPSELEGHIGPITSLDKVALVVLSGILIVLGLFPALMAPMVESGAQAVLRLVGGA